MLFAVYNAVICSSSSSRNYKIIDEVIEYDGNRCLWFVALYVGVLDTLTLGDHKLLSDEQFTR